MFHLELARLHITYKEIVFLKVWRILIYLLAKLSNTSMYKPWGQVLEPPSEGYKFDRSLFYRVCYYLFVEG